MTIILPIGLLAPCPPPPPPSPPVAPPTCRRSPTPANLLLASASAQDTFCPSNRSFTRLQIPKPRSCASSAAPQTSSSSLITLSGRRRPRPGWRPRVRSSRDGPRRRATRLVTACFAALPSSSATWDCFQQPATRICGDDSVVLSRLASSLSSVDCRGLSGAVGSDGRRWREDCREAARRMFSLAETTRFSRLYVSTKLGRMVASSGRRAGMEPVMMHRPASATE